MSIPNDTFTGWRLSLDGRKLCSKTFAMNTTKLESIIEFEPEQITRYFVNSEGQMCSQYEPLNFYTDECRQQVGLIKKWLDAANSNFFERNIRLRIFQLKTDTQEKQCSEILPAPKKSVLPPDNTQKHANPYKCEVCHECFTSKWNLVRHVECAHGNQNEQPVRQTRQSAARCISASKSYRRSPRNQNKAPLKDKISIKKK